MVSSMVANTSTRENMRVQNTIRQKPVYKMCFYRPSHRVDAAVAPTGRAAFQGPSQTRCIGRWQPRKNYLHSIMTRWCEKNAVRRNRPQLREIKLTFSSFDAPFKSFHLKHKVVKKENKIKVEAESACQELRNKMYGCSNRPQPHRPKSPSISNSCPLPNGVFKAKLASEAWLLTNAKPTSSVLPVQLVHYRVTYFFTVSWILNQ